MVAEETQKTFGAIAEGLLGGTQAQVDAQNAAEETKKEEVSQNKEDINVSNMLAQNGQNITEQTPEITPLEKDRGNGM